MDIIQFLQRSKLVYRISQTIAGLTMASLIFSPVAPVVSLYAQEADQTTESEESDSVKEDVTPSSDDGNESSPASPDAAMIVPDTLPDPVEPEPIEEVIPVETPPVSSPEKEQNQGLDPPVVEPVVEEPLSTTTEELLPTGKKFKKDPTLSPEEQLAAVRQHLLREKLPQEALDRLWAFEAKQALGPREDGIFTKIWNSVTSNTEEAKERKEAERVIKQEPFKVDGFEGEINIAPANQYEKDFSEAKEQGRLIQKVKNLIENGTFFNSNPARTKERKAGLLSRLLGSKQAMADASNDPNDYDNAGAEIVFTQAIQDKADELNHDPLAILNFVKNQVEYISYYGSKKGSAGTMAELVGNDTDKAALLIALLRYSGIPARYRHVDAKFDIQTVNSWFGVTSATSSAQIMSLEKIPYILYTLNGDPYFFVIEHTYVEAYMPYGVSRGADINDGGEAQWVPLDPTINGYIYTQNIDTIGEMNDDGFDVEIFFEDYLNGDYGISTDPLDAFKEEVVDFLAAREVSSSSPILAYDDVQTDVYRDAEEFNFIPGSLPFEISADIDTYISFPTSLRYTIEFTVTDDSNEVLNHTAYVSDLADRELLISYDAASTSDQTIINSFDTIYDVVPLSLVAVKPVIKINGDNIAVGSATTTLGYTQEYTMEFRSPRRTMGSSVTTTLDKAIEKTIITGNTDAIALNTDRIAAQELLSEGDTDSESYVANQILYQTALDYAGRLQDTHRDLASISGGDFTHVATGIAIFNGLQVTKSMGQPYSFDWKGLRVDAYSQVRYFHRFNDAINTNRKEFMVVFGLQASQEESDIFEDNFNVESVATVKGLKLVANGEFPGVTLEKFTEANEGDIDSLAISTTTKSVFHNAIGDGKIIYTPSEPITYGEWDGLFYIAIDFDGVDASYAIGEGLNGGFSVCGMPGAGGTICNWSQDFFDLLTPRVQASGITSSISASPSAVFVGQTVNVVIEYTKAGITWVKNFVYKALKPGVVKITPQYGSGSSTNVTVTNGSDATTVSCLTTLEGREIPETEGLLSEEMHIPLWIKKDSGVYLTRLNGDPQYNSQDDIYSHPTASEFIRKVASDNINAPWKDPKTDKYWNMSVSYAAFNRKAKSKEHELYYMNMRWHYDQFSVPEIYDEQTWYFGKKVWIMNPHTKKAVVAGILDYGPTLGEGAGGASPEVHKAIGTVHDDEVEFCWASDQDLPYGKVVNYTP